MQLATTNCNYSKRISTGDDELIIVQLILFYMIFTLMVGYAVRQENLLNCKRKIGMSNDTIKKFI